MLICIDNKFNVINSLNTRNFSESTRPISSLRYIRVKADVSERYYGSVTCSSNISVNYEVNYYGYFQFCIFQDEIARLLVLINHCAFIINSVHIYRTRIYRVLMFTNVISRQTARKFNHTLRNHKRNLNNNDVIFADFYL